ncbi:hypothetical protein [Candidatus Nitrosocosmicus hydrocola]|uniref:hypothetical protein n=1 Tax=Candidatus Nitrosocosmicus hydrocola TaxID=1826872 RepID=UPI0011E5C718|nr:hypothetical protein [Candidatus Nitrosocosmicus hydrocola]
MNKFFINYFITKNRFILLAIIVVVLFVLYFYIVSPSNFGSFSDTLRYYISALGTLLAVVVSFNTLALQNQMKNLPKDLSQVQDQINNLNDLLKPIQSVKESNSRSSINTDKSSQNSDEIKSIKLYDKEEEEILSRATENLTDAVRSIIIIVRLLSKQAIEDKRKAKEADGDSKLSAIYDGIIIECNSRLDLYKMTHHIFSVITISTTGFIQRLDFKVNTDKEDNTKAVYESLKRLHVLKSIGYSMFIRNMLADLSKELLISSIPVITFIGLIASISNYENYDIVMLRILFAISITIAAIPFILLFIRTMPILYLIKTSSTLPFSQ